MEKAIEDLLDEIEQLKAEMKKLIDPFYRAPKWAKWFAVNEDGEGTFFSHQPVRETHAWQPCLLNHETMSAGMFPELAKNWKTSSIEREEA